MNRELMGTKKIPSLLLQFSLPATVGMLVNALYNIVDRLFIGNSPDLGADGLAGITIGFPIMMILMAVALMCGVGGSTLFSISLGEKRYEHAKQVLGNAFALGIISAVLVSGLTYIFIDDILTLFGASGKVLPYARAYMEVILIGGIFQGINMTGNNLIRADGSPRIAMLSILLGAGVNIVLNPIFIYVFHWGMHGSALATIIGQFLSSVWIIYYFTKGKAHSRLELKNMIIKPALSLKILVTGLPSFFIQLSNSALNAILNTTLVTYGGDVAISSMGIVNSVQTLMMMPIIGINQGALPIIGYNFGANKLNRIKETIKIALIASTVIAVLGFIATRLFSTQIILAFNNDPALVKLGSRMILAWFMCLPILGIQLVCSNFFQAIGKVVPAITLSLTRQVIILIPLIILLSARFGMDGLIYAAPIADVAATILTITFFSITMKRLSKKENINEYK